MFIKYFLDYSIKLEYKSSIKALDPVWVDSLATTNIPYLSAARILVRAGSTLKENRE